ncbi:MAG TPA: asparagine synthase-related protein [Chitinophagales bacterium]|nr:asparagine synthase-related protein [Chitinophagales bacterium]
MKIDLNLSYPGKFQWSKNENLYFIGYAFDNERKLYQNAQDFDAVDVQNIINELNGAFSIIQLSHQQLLITTDTIASFPLFYRIKRNEITISSTPHFDIHDSLNEAAVKDYEKVFCTQFQDTLLTDWKSIPAGHQLKVDIANSKIILKRYFNHYVTDKAPSDTATKSNLIEIIENWAKQIIQFADQRPIWIPLSGGYDSRLILSALVKEKAPNLHAYTYGKSLSVEVVNAHKVAKQLEVDWHFIPYNEQAFQYFFSDIWNQYALGNHHFQSLPHEQDFFALLALKSQGVLQEDFVIVPGFCGDIPTGSYLKNIEINTENYIQDQYQVHAKNLVDNIEPWDSFQQWLTENRLSKFIVNSVRVYEYFGGKWMLPMWHRDFLELFYELETQEKFNQKFYTTVIFESYFEPMEIDFVKSGGDSVHAEITPKEILKKILPQALVQTIQKYTGKSSQADPCNLNSLYELLYMKLESQKFRLPKKDRNFNRLHAIYMLELIKNSMK